MTDDQLQTLLGIDRDKLPPDGGPKFNRLIFANSPYLLQHAENPVDWREWGPPALAEARSRNLPLFVSIGYATCHWCHVMAHESFEDQEVADLLNHAFIPIKVDREERPDLDEFCMAACQALSGSGGWPLNCFLKPDGSPFYALTYLPKEPRPGLSGFLELLENIALVWQQRPEAVEQNATALLQALQQRSTPPHPTEQLPLPQLADQAAATLRRIYDRRYAGFGSAPKFPMPPYLLFLLRRDDAADRELALNTLQAMRQGGIWDQLGGGIHRYSTDRQWLVPHFEKMLYDQALLAYVALEAFELTGEMFYREMAENLLEFILNELAAPEGGFYCGLDADAAGREGSSYLWRMDEIEQLLGDNAPLCCDSFGITRGGNYEQPGENISTLALTPPELIERYGSDALQRREQGRLILVAARRQRVQPLCDKKIVAGWNGLAIAALAKGARLTDKRHWLDAALQAAAFIRRTMLTADGRLLRSYLKTASDIKGFLDDYTWLTWGCLELFIARTDPHLLTEAARLCNDTLRLFGSSDGLLTTAGNDAEQMPVPVNDLHDGVTPSAVAVLLVNLLTLAELTGEPGWQQQAELLWQAHRDAAQESPVAHLWLLQAGMEIEKKQKRP